jgi:hypothetical protein
MREIANHARAPTPLASIQLTRWFLGRPQSPSMLLTAINTVRYSERKRL